MVMKAAQLGVSEWAIRHALHAADQRLADTMYVFPTAADISDFSASRVGPAIEANAHLRAVVGTPVDDTGKRRTNRVTLRRVRNNHIYLRGGTVKPDGRAPQLKSVPADIIILDELDEMDERVEAIAAKRLNASRLGEFVRVSTPTFSRRGIHSAYLDSDQRVWLIACPHCGHKQPMVLDNLIIENDDHHRPVAWYQDSNGRAILACIRCKGKLDTRAPGEWVATRPGRETAGYHLSGFLSPMLDLDKIIRLLSKPGETDRRETMNQDLGLPYTPVGGQLTHSILVEASREYALGVHRGEPTYMGVDVGPEWLHVVIRAPLDNNGERRLRYVGTVSRFEDLDRLIKKFNVRRVVVDMLPEVRSARAFQARHRDGRVWVAEYKDNMRDPDAVVHDARQGIVLMDRTRTLDATIGAFIFGENVIPATTQESPPEYWEQLTSSVRVVVSSVGGRGQIARYHETGPDHYLHAENYSLAAAQKVQGTAPPGVVVTRGARGW